MSAAGTTRWGAFAALQHRDFRLFWAGQAISLTGTQMQRVAVAWHVYELTRSPVALGAVGLCRVIPVLLLALPGGVVADRLDRKAVMLWSTVAMAAVSLVLWVCTVTGTLTLPVIYACVAVGGAANAFNGPARQALVPNMVPPASLQPALTLAMLTWDVAGVSGPALGGLVLAGYGAAIIYLLDAVSYGAVALAVLRMGPVPGPAPRTHASPLQDMREALRFVFGHRLIAATMLLDFFATLLGQSTMLFPLFAVEVLHEDAAVLGLMYSAPAAGSVVTGLLMALMPPVRRHGAVLLGSVALYGAATVVFGMSTQLWLTLCALTVVGAADTVSTMLRQVLRHRMTPDELRGRMTGVNMVFFQGGPQLGEMEAGLAAAVLGPALAVAGGGVGVVALVVWTAWRVPHLRTWRDTPGPS